jgi:hypothetical protein
MARSSEAASDAVKARAEYAKFIEAWKNCDAGLPEMDHAREYVQGEKVLASTGAGK